MGEIKLPGFICERCDYIWVSRIVSDQKPLVCPRCKSPYWNTPRKNGNGNGHSNSGSQSKKIAKQVEEEMDDIFPWKTKKN
jgi:hypothetical protein